MLGLVRAQAARGAGACLGRGGGAGPGVPRPGVRLADRGGAAEPAGRGDGLRLPATLVFDYPTPAVLAAVPAGRSCWARRAGRGRGRGGGRLPAAGEPVAIVGMGCRFPGGAAARRSCGSCWPAAATRSSGFPADRGWDLDGLYDPDPDHAGTSYAREGGFVARRGGVRRGVLRDQPAGGAGDGPAAAAAARGVLGGAGAGRDRPGRRCAARRTGVFAGADRPGYGAGLAGGPAGAEGYLLTGDRGQRDLRPGVVRARPGGPGGDGGHGVLVVAGGAAPGLPGAAGRGVHLALAGGVAVMATPGDVRRVLPAAGAGRGRAVQGVRRGRGRDRAGPRAPGWCVLERLSDARRNGHRVLAVVAGSAVNQDGASNGLTAPNGPSQQRVIRAGAGQRGAVRRPRWTRWRRTGPGPRWATRSRRRRCSPPTGRTGRRTGRCGWGR